jgi:hypothetical protein
LAALLSDIQYLVKKKDNFGEFLLVAFVKKRNHSRTKTGF